MGWTVREREGPCLEGNSLSMVDLIVVVVKEVTHLWEISRNLTYVQDKCFVADVDILVILEKTVLRGGVQSLCSTRKLI